ncbi:TenA family transcriptional regulator [Prosthecobacter sp.]|uniref:TenA family transcriptional regulator n=1 Tax=Prosthecobacter sp. TaxID=1965333 RepID=UPI003782D5A3
MEELLSWVAAQADACRILKNHYFTALEDGSLDRERFCETQQQFFFAVRYFSRPMAALMARMPSSALRRSLVHNLAEEHGYVDEVAPVFDPALAHDMTFLRFLETLGVSRAEMNHVREAEAVRAFNTSLMGVCMMERTDLALACLGVIEHVFADISARIGRTAVERGWVPAEKLVHYNLHQEIDGRHAAEFFECVLQAWQGGGEGRAAVEDGVKLGLHVFDRLYVDLWKATTHPHEQHTAP